MSDKADKITLPTADRRFQARFDIVVPHRTSLRRERAAKGGCALQFYTGADKTYSTSLHALNRSQAAGRTP